MAAKASIDTKVKALIKDGVTESAMIKAHLVLDGYKTKEIVETLKALGVTGAKKEFRAIFHDYLVEKNPTEAEVTDYVMGKGEYGETSENVKRHLSVYLNEYKLAKRIRDKYETKNKAK